MNIIYDMPAGNYHSHPAVSKSVLDKIARSPAHARAYLEGDRTAPTASMLFGTALHTAVLEPHRFANEYAVFDGDRRTKAGKEAYEAMLASGVNIISAADRDVIFSMVESITHHPDTADLLLGGAAEASVFWKDPATGLQCKCRPDYWHEKRGVVVDIKTCEDASYESFRRNVSKYRYHVQAAHYLAGTQAERFLLVAVEKSAPYALAVYELTPEALANGLKKRDRDLAAYASCAEFGVWPGYPRGVQAMDLPDWEQEGEEDEQ